MIPALRGSAAHVFVGSLDDPFLADDDAHHLVRVLRLRPGEVVSISDGSGSWRLCRFGVDGALLPDSDVWSSPSPQPQITIGFALPKGDRTSWIAEKLTEIGVDRLIVLHTERSATTWQSDRAAFHLAKLRKVVRLASMQSRRVFLPIIEGPVGVDDRPLAAAALAEPGGGDALSLELPTILIGPEGGWSEDELGVVSAHVDLGPLVMRIETAALVAAARLTDLRDRVGAPCRPSEGP